MTTNNSTNGGRQFVELFHVTDWMPTILSIAGISLPQVDAIVRKYGCFHCENNITSDRTENDYCYVDKLYDVKTIDGIDLSYSLPLHRTGFVSTLIITNHWLVYYVSLVTQSTKYERKEILIEFYCKEDSVFKQDLFAYRYGDMKLVLGS